MIVVDTSVLASLYLPLEHTRLAEALLEREPEWAAPLLWRSEFRSILAGCLRSGVLDFEQARDLQAEAESLLLGAEYEVEPIRVLELIRDSDCSPYDCEFAALAALLGVKLVTTNAGLLRAFPNRTVALGDA